MTEDLSNLEKEIDIQVQAAQRVLYNAKRPSPSYIIIKMQKLKTKRES